MSENTHEHESNILKKKKKKKLHNTDNSAVKHAYEAIYETCEKV